MKVDLNADMGEGFGPWKMGQDESLLDIVTSANIACGMHAGDWDVMYRTMRMAVDRNVRIGCHPGFADLQGFGRRRIPMQSDSLKNLVRYQLGASQAMAKAAGGRVVHLKLHGAMANMAAEDEAMAACAYEAALDVDPDLLIYVIAGTAQERAARLLGCAWAGEIFADRAYNDDATLVDRGLPGAVIHDTEVVVRRVLEMVREGAIISQGGKRIPTRIDTICHHGDTAGAVELARSVRRGLLDAGVELGF